MNCPIFEAGLRHFRQQEYYEAHEEWEKLWLKAQGKEKTFLQALILICGSLVHKKKGRPEPCLRLWALAQKRLLEAEDAVCEGIQAQVVLDRFPDSPDGFLF